MKPEEALQLLDRIIARVAMSRADHTRAIEAMSVLQGMIIESQKSKGSEKNGENS